MAKKAIYILFLLQKQKNITATWSCLSVPHLPSWKEKKNESVVRAQFLWLCPHSHFLLKCLKSSESTMSASRAAADGEEPHNNHIICASVLTISVQPLLFLNLFPQVKLKPDLLRACTALSISLQIHINCFVLGGFPSFEITWNLCPWLASSCSAPFYKTLS